MSASGATPIGKIEKDNLLLWFLVISVVVIVTLCCYVWLMPQLIASWTERGQFGDMFGAVNTLFSGLAFSALVCALILQSRELEATRKEFAKQSEAQTDQAETALKAAKIAALGALLQSYTTLVTSGNTNLIDPSSWPDEILMVKAELKKLLMA